VADRGVVRAHVVQKKTSESDRGNDEPGRENHPCGGEVITPCPAMHRPQNRYWVQAGARKIPICCSHHADTSVYRRTAKVCISVEVPLLSLLHLNLH